MNILRSTICLLLLVPLIGCATTRSGSVVHDDIRGERVTINLIPYKDYDDCNSAIRSFLITQSIALPPKPVPQTPSKLTTTAIDSVVGAVIGAIVEYVQVKLKEEAAKHERQFGATLYAGDFWDANGSPKYAGFEVIRTTDSHPSKDPAYRLICAFEYSEGDSRICLIRPVYLRVDAAKAKVTAINGKRRISTKSDILMTGAWIDHQNAFRQQDLANASFAYSAYDVAKPATLKSTWTDNVGWTGELATSVYGYFRTPPLSEDKTAGGAFQLSVLVTERDESKTAKTLVRIADYIGAQKQVIVESVTK